MTPFDGSSLSPGVRPRRATSPCADSGLATETSVFALALEPRYLFDAAGLATGAELTNQTAEQAGDQSTEPATIGSDAPAVADGTRQPEPAEDPAMDQALAQYQPPAVAETESPRQILFIDASIGGYEALVAAAQDSVEVVLLDPAGDAILQIRDHLDGRTGIQSIHIVSHGGAGEMVFGGGTISTENLADYAQALEQIGDTLTTDGDLLLYGCYVGADGEGRAFIEALAQATGADVAASDDLTGASTLGGDWTLETAAGSIESEIFASHQALHAFTSVLVTDSFDFEPGTGTVTGSTEANFGTAGSTITQQIAGLGTLQFTFSGVGGFVSDEITVLGSNVFASSAGDLAWSDQGAGEATSVTVSFTNGQAFDLNSLDISEATGGSAETFVLTTNALNSVTTNSLNGTEQSLDVSGNASFDGITSFTITSQNGPFSIALDNISVSVINPPSITNLSGDTLAYTEGDGAQVLDQGSAAVVSDSDSPDFDGGNLTAAITGATASEDLAISTAGTVGLSAGMTVGSTVSVGGTAIGTIAGGGTGQDGSNLVVSLNANATPARVSTLLQAITYANDSETPSGSRTVSLTVNDGGLTSSAATVTVNLTGVNDAPTATGVPTDVTVVEDTASNLDLSAVTFADADGDSLTVAIAASSGTLTASSGGGVTVGGSGTGTITLAGTAANINTFLDTVSNIQYVGASNASGNDAATFTINANDGTVNPQLGSGNIDITAVNDEPTLSATGANPAFSEGGGAVDLFSGVSASTVEAAQTLTSMTLTVSNLSDGANEILSFDGSEVQLTNGFNEPSTATNGLNVSVSVTGSTATVSFSGATLSAAALQTLVDGLGYRNAAGEPTAGVRTVTLTQLVDSGANGGSDDNTAALSIASTVTVSAVNDPPAFSGLDGTPAFTEGGAAVTLDSSVTVADAELAAAGDYAGASLTVARNGGADASDSFGFDTTGALFTVSGSNLQSGGQTFATFTNTGGTLTISFTSSVTTATQALVNDVLQRIQYQNTNDAPPATAQLDWTFSDGNAGNAQGTGDNPGTATGSTTVTIAAVNDNPSVTGVPASISITEDVQGNLDISASSFADPDSASITVTLSVSAGTIGLAAPGGIAVTLGGNGTSSVTVTGSAADINSYLDTPSNVVFTPPANVSGSGAVTLTIAANDGDGSGDLTLGTVPINITAVNDPPVIGGVAGDSSGVTAGAGAQDVTLFDDATVTDVDSPDYNGGSLSLLQGSGTTNGNWGLDGTTATAGGDGTIAAGETISVGGTAIGTVHVTNDGQGGSTLQIDFDTANSSPANIQALLRALTYSAPSGLGARTFTAVLNDGDGAANGGDADTTASFTINVQPNPPVVSNLDGDSVSAANNVAVAIDQGGNATVADPDSANFNGGNLTVTRTSGLSGNFSLDGTGATAGGDGTIGAGETVSVGGTAIGTVTADGQGANNLVFSFGSNATPARVQALIRALQFASTSGGAHTFSLTVTDAGASAGTSTAAAFTVNVEAGPVNTVPGAQTVVDGTATAIAGVSVADADSANVTTTLSVGAGAISVTDGGGAVITGNGSTSVQVAGTIAQVNAALAGLGYTAPANSATAQTITVTSSDGTNSDVDTIAVNVRDRPDIANLDGDSSVAPAGTPVAFDAGGDAAVGDLDSTDFNNGNLTIARNTALTGNFSLDGTNVTANGDGVIAAGETLSVGGTAIGSVTSDGQGGNNLVISLNLNATPARVGTLLNNLFYAADTAAAQSFAVTVNDGDGATSPAATVAFTAPPVTPPVVTPPPPPQDTSPPPPAPPAPPAPPPPPAPTPVQAALPTGDGASTARTPITQSIAAISSPQGGTPIAQAFYDAATSRSGGGLGGGGLGGGLGGGGLGGGGFGGGSGLFGYGSTWSNFSPAGSALGGGNPLDDLLGGGTGGLGGPGGTLGGLAAGPGTPLPGTETADSAGGGVSGNPDPEAAGATPFAEERGSAAQGEDGQVEEAAVPAGPVPLAPLGLVPAPPADGFTGQLAAAAGGFDGEAAVLAQALLAGAAQ